MLLAYSSERLCDRCIRDVHAVPGYQEIHAVHGCYGNMRGVSRSHATSRRDQPDENRPEKYLRGDHRRDYERRGPATVAVAPGQG